MKIERVVHAGTETFVKNPQEELKIERVSFTLSQMTFKLSSQATEKPGTHFYEASTGISRQQSGFFGLSCVLLS
jgi:hypothetical protein